MAKKFVRENVPLSRFGVLVAQLESIVASAAQQPPDAVLCFDLLSDLLSAIDEEPKESILLWQRKCEDALYSLLTLGAHRPVRHLASLAMARIISKGDTISIYSRASSLQGFLSDGKRSEPLRFTGAAQCLGELYRSFGRRITSGLLETTIIASKLMKFPEVFVRQEALRMLESALEGSGGTAAFTAYSEAFRLIMRSAVGDKSFIVRIAAARCLKAFANIGGPGLGVGELENSANCCVKALEDPVSSVRDAFAEALGMLIALGMNPEAQVQPRVKGHIAMAKKLEGGLQRHLSSPFMKANGARAKDVRIGLTFSWVFFLQAIRMKYLHPDSDLQNFATQVMDMLRFDGADDAQALACVLYILRVGVTDQMTEPTQRGFLVLLGKQLQSSDVSPSMKIAALRTLAYTLKTLGEVPLEFREVLDDTVVASLSHSSQLVRIEAALALRALAEVDPTCVGGLVSYGVTTLNALRENISFEKGNNLKVELDSLHGQAIVLAALVTISPKLPLGYPARLPRSVLEVSKEMLAACSRIPVVANVEREAGWLLLASLLASMPKEELEDQVFDILSLWASVFSGNPEDVINNTGEIASGICVWSAAVDALTAFVRCFVSPSTLNSGILLQPVVVYLSRALSYISFVAAKEIPDMKPAMDIFIIRILIAYQSLPDTMIYKTDHSPIIQICTTPFRDAPGCVESSCLRLLLDKRDAWLGPWTPGRDWFEDELRAFEGGKDGLLPCIWESEVATFPQADTISKTVVNQMLLCFGIMFASQDSGGMFSLLGMMEQCLKSGKKQPWHSASVTNTCVGLLCGLKALLALRPQPLALEILNSAQTIFLGILAEGDICASQRRASAEGLGLLARLGNDIFTARMTKLLLGDITVTTDLTYAGSIAFALGCIHRSAGGMALSSLVPSTVSSISLLAKSSNPGLQIWSLHGLILTIEASGLSYVSHAQATLGLAMDLLQSQENVWLDLQQGVGQLINAIVAVLGPELAPGSIFFSRCKSVVAEISFQQEIATLLESVRFTQQLVLFAPQALSMHTHLQTLLPTLSSRQPTLRHMGISTLRHLIEKDPVAIIIEQIEDELFHMLDEETDSEIGNLVRTTIMRLLYVSCPSCPSRWLSICRKMVLASSTRRRNETDNSERDSANAADGDTKFGFGEDDDNMVSSYNSMANQGHIYDVSNVNRSMDKNLRFRTRIFAAECLSHLPTSVGNNSAHFDLSLARKARVTVNDSGDWLVLKLQELISLAYQISTMQFENMQPIGVGLLSTIVDKFEMIPDPEFPGHLLLEQYQAQLVSAVRNALNPSSGPVLLEAGLQLATKILTCGIISGDQAAVKRIFSLISRPLNDFKDLYYPSFAEWVSCKIKVRLLAAHASLKCYTFALLRRPFSELPDEYVALTSLFSQRSSTLGRYWIYILKDYSWICFRLLVKRNWKPFLDEIKSPLVSSKLLPCLEEAWPVILQAIALDAVPASSGTGNLDTTVENSSVNSLISGYSMVELNADEFQFLWGFALLVLFQGQHSVLDKQIIPLNSTKANFGGDSPVEEASSGALKLYEIVLPVFQFLSTERFFSAGFLTLDACKELLQVFSYSRCAEDAWNSLAVSVLMQIVQNCPDSFLENEDFAYSTMELCSAYLLKILLSTGAMKPDKGICEDSISLLLKIAKTLMMRFEPKKQLKWVLAVLLIGYKCLKRASTEQCFSHVNNFIQSTFSLLKKQYDDKLELADDFFPCMRTILGACLNVVSTLTRDFIEDIYLMQNKRPNLTKLLQMKLFFSLEQAFSFAKLGHEIGQCEECVEGNIYFPLYKVSVDCFKDVLADSNMQVRAVGLQVLKSVLHRSVNLENSSFLLFFAGELFSDIFLIIHEISKKPSARERGTLVDDCLRILVLLQTLSNGTECEKSIMKLLLEAVFLVLSASEDGVFQQETNDIRSTAIRLVSQLAQIPSSAVKLKDALLGMPITNRQQLQDILRASAAQDSVATLNKSAAPSLVIKLPMQNEEIGAMTTLSSSTSHSDRNSLEEEDDWEAFQSFPASIDTAATNPSAESAPESFHLTENSTVLDFNSGNDASQRGSVSFPPYNAEEMIKAKPLESSGDEIFETVCSGSAEEIIEAAHLESSREGDMFETGGSGTRKERIGPEHLESREGEISDSAGSGNADEFISTECLESRSEEDILETSSSGNARQIEAEYLGSSREGKIFETEDNESRTEDIHDVERLERSRLDSELSRRNSMHSDCPGPDQNNSQVFSDYKPTEKAEGSPSKSDCLDDNEVSSGFLKSGEPDARTDRDETAEADQGIGKNSRTGSGINEPHPKINDDKGIPESENDGTKQQLISRT